MTLIYLNKLKSYHKLNKEINILYLIKECNLDIKSQVLRKGWYYDVKVRNKYGKEFADYIREVEDAINIL